MKKNCDIIHLNKRFGSNIIEFFLIANCGKFASVLKFYFSSTVLYNYYGLRLRALLFSVCWRTPYFVVVREANARCQKIPDILGCKSYS
jgi:hypothetical protein